MSVYHIEQSERLRAEGMRLGRAGLSKRVVDLVAAFDGSYKGAIILAGRLHAIALAARADSYWHEKADYGFRREVEEIQTVQKEQTQ